MSARYDGPPVPPPRSYGHHGPREHDAQNTGTPAGISPSSGQFPRLPSLNSWAHIPPQSPVIASGHPQRAAQVEADRSSRLPHYQATQPSYQSTGPESFASGRPATPPNLVSFVSETKKPDMCFRGNSYREPGYGEPRPRYVVGMGTNVAAAPPGYLEQTSRPPSYNATMFAPKDQPTAPTGRKEMQSKRQANSPIPQLPPTKKAREQSPASARPRVRTREVVPNLLGPERAHLVRGLKFTLKIRQQPQQARSCGFADKDRRAIDPPPIVELKIEGEGLTKKDLDVYMNYDRYVMCCTLLDENGVDAMNMEQDGLRSKRMMGENTVVPFVGNDEHGEPGCFFTFNDLSCRTPGDYRLSFSVSALPTAEESRTGVRYPRMTDITSDIFKAYNAKLFPGMTESSALARALKEQGCNISVRKGNEKTKNARGRNTNRDGEDEDDDY